MASRTQDVTKARQKAQEAGRRRLSAMLSVEGSRRYDVLRERYESERALVEAALASLEQRGEISNAELAALVASRLGG